MSKELEEWLEEELTKDRLESAWEMLKDDLSFDKIAKYTRLPLPIIKILAQQLKRVGYLTQEIDVSTIKMSEEMENWLNSKRSTLYAEGYSDNYVEGFILGYVEAKKETALAMLEDNIPVSKINQCTKIPLQDLENLAKQYHFMIASQMV